MKIATATLFYLVFLTGYVGQASKFCVGGLQKLGLPYYFTPDIKGDLVLIPGKIKSISQPHQVFAINFEAPADVIRAKAYVESWHYLKVTLEGKYILIRFENAESRSNFLKTNKIPLVLDEVALADSGQGVLIKVEDYLNVKKQTTKVSFQREFQSAFELVDVEVLKRLSDQTIVTRSGVKYYFLGSKPIGFERNGQSFLIKGSGPENFASHAAILRRQRRASPNSDLPSMKEVREEALAKSREMERNFSDVDRKIISDLEKSLKSFLSTSKSRGENQSTFFRQKLAWHLMELIKVRATQWAKSDFGIKSAEHIEDLLPSGQDQSFIRYLWLANPNGESGALLVTAENLLHDQILIRAFGPRISQLVEVQELLRGGVFLVEQAKIGVKVNLPPELQQMGLFDPGSPNQLRMIKMNQEEVQQVAAVLDKILFISDMGFKN
ncbi:MAG: hypothetical protein IT289_12390 [Oligoflexia bacterium]|nr:hypothetical protein [Oligoflexia bacterium]